MNRYRATDERSGTVADPEGLGVLWNQDWRGNIRASKRTEFVTDAASEGQNTFLRSIFEKNMPLILIMNPREKSWIRSGTSHLDAIGQISWT